MKKTSRLRRILVSLSLILTTSLVLNIVTADYGYSSDASSEKAANSSFKKVSSGDTIYGILSKVGFDREARNAAISKKILPSSFTLAPGDIYEVISHSKTGKTIVRFYDDFKNLTYDFWMKGKDIAGASIGKTAFTKKKVSVEGKIVGSIVGSIRAKTGDSLMGYRFMDAFIVDYDLKKRVHKNAKFKMTYEKLYAGDQFIRNGQIVKADLEIDDKLVQREFISTPEGGIYYDKEDSQKSRPLYSPVGQVRISSLYQPRRFHPVRKVYRAHLGIDYELPEGEKVFAAQRGRVVRFGRNRGAGNFVVIKHNNGLETYYNHLKTLAPNLRKNQILYPGAVIGEIGCTGLCTKPHLHFAVKKNGKYVNPIKYVRRYAYAQRFVAMR